MGLADARKQPRTGKKKGKGKTKAKRKAKAQPAGRAATEAADCLSPGPSSNMNGCNFNNRDFVDANLSSSAMRGTKFRGANLCGADLSSSQLKRADFRGFAAGNPTNLFRADLSSSGCRGTRFNARTLFCRTKTCSGSFRDDDCPAGVDPQDVCCSDAECPAGQSCAGGVCHPPCGGCVQPVGDACFLVKWGSRGSGNGQFNLPRGVAVAADGTVYVADTGNDRIQAFCVPPL